MADLKTIPTTIAVLTTLIGGTLVYDVVDDVEVELSDKTVITFDNEKEAIAAVAEATAKVEKKIVVFADETAEEKALTIDIAEKKQVKHFAKEAEYLTYRDPLLADRKAWSLEEYYEKSREMTAIYTYEWARLGLVFTSEEVKAMKDTDIREIMESKIKLK